MTRISKGQNQGHLVKHPVNLRIKMILLKTHDAEVKSEVWEIAHTHTRQSVHQALCILSTQGGPPPQPV